VRPYLLLIAVALLTAFAAGTLSFDLARGALPDAAMATGAAQLKAGFEAGREPTLLLDLGLLFPPGDGLKLLDPREALPQSQRYPADQLGALVKFADSCASSGPVTAPALAKALAWHRFECRGTELPPSFFESPPFLHPSGNSFAALGAARLGRPWALAHQRLFHVLEWEDPTGLEPSRALLATASRETLLALAAAEPLVLSAREVLIARAGSADAAPGRRYAVYPRADWDAFLSRAPLLARPGQVGEACVEKEGSVCWVRNQAPYFTRLSRLTVALLALSLLSTVAAVALLLGRVKGQRAEEERQRFVLQTLTHELRTPVASLLVSLESLRRDFDQLAPEAQRDLLRVVDDAARLRRLVERSRAYLSSGPGAPLLSLSPSEVPSVQAFAAQALEPWREQLQLKGGVDGPVFVDTWWVGTCLGILVENALAHGAPPVEVTVEKLGAELSVCVRDGGRLSGEKSPRAGLGLGLSIVRRALEAMGSRLEVSENPTRFAFRVPAGGR
jgi:signal transduction histidine kinase